MSVRHALLALLSEGPKYGLQLREEFEANTGEVWPLNGGQVYTTLQRLERDGLVAALGGTGSWCRDRRRPTGSPRPGPPSSPQWLRVPPDLSTPPRDDLVMKVLIAAAGAGHRCLRGHPGAPAVPGPAHAGVDPAEGRRQRPGPGVRAGRPTPSCSGWTPLSAGWTRPRPGCAAPWPTAGTPARAFSAPAGVRLPTRPTMGARR